MTLHPHQQQHCSRFPVRSTIMTSLVRHRTPLIDVECGLFAWFFVTSEFDRDGNGLISVSELRHTLNAMNQSANEKISEFEAMQLVHEADRDGDHMIDYDGQSKQCS